MTAPELAFLHIPKTAGTSQRSAFKKYHGAENVFWFGVECPPHIQTWPRKLIAESAIVGGHKFLSFYPGDIDPLYCAILRDPVQRAISLFVYYTRPDLARAPLARKERAALLENLRSQGIEPESMLLSIRECQAFREEITNYQCRYLSRGDNTFTDVLRSLQGVDHAIGTVDDHNRFHYEVGGLLDWSLEPPISVNRSRGDYSAPYLQDEELLAEIRRLNREDQKLFDWVAAEHRGLWLKFRDPDERRRRLRGLPRARSQQPQRSRKLQAAGELWPPRGEAKLRWPLGRMMVAVPQRLVFMPTPGAADTVVQQMMLELSAVPHKRELMALGIDTVVERYATGLVLDDRSEEEIRTIAGSADYFRFAIVYDPISRLVEVFEQRFVQMRAQLPQWRELHQLVTDSQQRAEADCELGISFRQFVQACVSGRYRHRLLLTQNRYLPWPDSYDRFYRPQQLPLLARDLSELRGIAVQLPEITLAPVPQPGRAECADIPAGRLPRDPALWREQLLDESLLEMIGDFYAKDFRLYNRTADNNRERVAG